MGILENIKESVGDISQGVSDVIHRRKSSAYLRQKRRNEAEWERIVNNPAPSQNDGYTPVKGSSGRIVYNSPYSGGGGGSSGGGGGYQAPSGVSQAELKRIAEQKARELAQQKAEAKRIAEQKAEAKRIAEQQAKNQKIALLEQQRKEQNKNSINQTIQQGKQSIFQATEKTKRPTGKTILYNKQGQPTGIETNIGGGMQSMSIDAYNKEIERRQKVYPNISTSDINLNIPQPDRTGQIYDPRTNMFLKSPYGLGAGGTAIMSQPTPSEQGKINRAEVMGNYAPLPEGITATSISEKIIRGGIDFAQKDFGIPIIGGGSISAGDIKQEAEKQLNKKNITFTEKLVYTPFSKMPTTYGDLTVLTASGYLAPVTTGVGIGAMLFEPLIKEGLVTGGKKVEQTGKFLMEYPATSPLGLVTDITGKAIQGSSTLVPEKPTDILTFALFEKALASKVIPKIVKSGGLKSLAGYEIYGGLTNKNLSPEQRYGKFLIGGLSAFGSIPEDVTLGRKFKARLSKDFTKTNIGELGIQETKLDLGHTNIKIKSPIEAEMEKTFAPTTLEFIPTRSESFSGRIDPLKIMSKEIPLKENPKLPKINNKKQQIIFDIAKKNEDIFTGSFSQGALVRGSRKWKADLDLISKNPKKTIADIKNKLGDKVVIKFKKVAYAIYDKSTGKELANVVPYRIGEAGYVRIREPIKLEGVNLLPPEVRLVSKVYQQTIKILPKQRKKVALDIAQLIEEKELATSPSLLRGYGVAKAEQAKLAEGEKLYFTHGGLGIKSKEGKIILEKDLFATQSLMKEGILSARKSRMGFKDIKYASWLDLLKPSERKKISFIPKTRDVIFGEAGTMRGGKTEFGWEIPEIKSTEIEIKKPINIKKPQEFEVLKEMYTILEGEPIRIRQVKEITERKKLVRDSKISKDKSDLDNFLKNQERGRAGERERINEELILRTPQRPIFKATTRTPTRDIPREIIRDIPRSLPRATTKPTARPSTKLTPRTTPRDIPRATPRTPPRDIPRELTRDIPRTNRRTLPRTNPRAPPRNIPITPSHKKGVIPKSKQANSYDVIVKSKGKYRKITKKPVSFVDARDLQSYAIDKSIARTSYLKPRQNNPSRLMYAVPSGYYQSTKGKYRNWMQRKGKRYPLKNNKIIEYSKNALDTPSEVKQLNVFKILAKREKKKMNKNKPIGLSFA